MTARALLAAITAGVLLARYPVVALVVCVVLFAWHVRQVTR